MTVERQLRAPAQASRQLTLITQNEELSIRLLLGSQLRELTMPETTA